MYGPSVIRQIYRCSKIWPFLDVVGQNGRTTIIDRFSTVSVQKDTSTCTSARISGFKITVYQLQVLIIRKTSLNEAIIRSNDH